MRSSSGGSASLPSRTEALGRHPVEDLSHRARRDCDDLPPVLPVLEVLTNLVETLGSEALALLVAELAIRGVEALVVVLLGVALGRGREVRGHDANMRRSPRSVKCVSFAERFSDGRPRTSYRPGARR